MAKLWPAFNSIYMGDPEDAVYLVTHSPNPNSIDSAQITVTETKGGHYITHD